MEPLDINSGEPDAGTGTTLSVHAGFPNPAAERSEAPLSLDKLLIRHPGSTYFFRIRGHQWHRYGVFDGDLALVDRSLVPKQSDLVVWWQESGEFCLSQLSATPPQTSTTWGTITALVHPTQPNV